MLDITVWEVVPKKRMVGDVQVKEVVISEHDNFNSVPRMVHEEAGHAISSQLGSSADSPDPAENMPIFEASIVEEDAP